MKIYMNLKNFVAARSQFFKNLYTFLPIISLNYSPKNSKKFAFKNLYEFNLI